MGTRKPQLAEPLPSRPAAANTHPRPLRISRQKQPPPPHAFPPDILKATSKPLQRFTTEGEAICAHAAGRPMSPDQYPFANVRDGLRGIEFGCKSVESCDAGSIWVKMDG